jgi:hypothetical protein
MTKSGANSGHLRRCSGVSAADRRAVTQAASGERSAPFGNLKPPEESKTLLKLGYFWLTVFIKQPMLMLPASRAPQSH